MCFISAIILAAGESKRMGESKLLLKWRGASIFEETVDNYLASAANEVTVILGNQATEMEKLIGDRTVTVAINPAYAKGMSTSIVIGINVMSPRTQGIMLALADQPSVTSQTIDKLIQVFQLRKKGIIVPTYHGQRGNPVIFDIKYRKELLALQGDTGGRDIVGRFYNDIQEVPVENRGVLIDIDTPEDYRRQQPG
ncbi:MAG: molybdenum cofactor cytidylyltransferase [Dehalococcoidales bacterium]|nr:molybdenum cofactor cytidylyltransferase [Dehalococcoidales bacterium]